MSEKALSEIEWKKLSKGRDLKDAALLKGLAALDKADKDPAARLGALDDIEKQSEQLRKSARNDREVKAFLDDMAKAVERQRRQARQDEKAAEAESEEEETPALLTSKMLPLLRDVRKGDVMQALIATSGKTAVVLLSRRAIAPTRRKLLSEALGQTGGVKYIAGECLFEQKAHTFVVTAEVGGLAKKLRAALLEQTGLRLKVRVRGDDPALVDADGEDEDDAEAVSATPDAADASDQQRTAFEARLQRTETALQDALRAQRGDASRLRAVAAFAREKGEAGQYKRASSALDSLDKLLEAVPAEAPAAASASSRVVAELRSRLLSLGPRIQQAVAASADKDAIVGLVAQLQQSLQQGDATQSQALLKSLAQRLVDAQQSADAAVPIVQLQRARLNWATTRATLRQRLRMLELKTLDFFADRPEFADAQTAVRRLDEVLAELDDDLIDTLDEALNEADPARRRDIQAEARLCVEDYADFVRSSALVADLDANPFAKVDIRDTVLRSVEQLHAALG